MPSTKRDISVAKRLFKKVRFDARNAMGQAEFVASLLGVAA